MRAGSCGVAFINQIGAVTVDVPVDNALFSTPTLLIAPGCLAPANQARFKPALIRYSLLINGNAALPACIAQDHPAIADCDQLATIEGGTADGGFAFLSNPVHAIATGQDIDAGNRDELAAIP